MTGSAWTSAPSRVRRLVAVTASPTARMSMAPLKMGSTKKGAPIWLSPATVTARTATARYSAPNIDSTGSNGSRAKESSRERRKKIFLSH